MNQYIDFFKVYLFSRKYSKTTVKNYVADVSRFVNWYEATYPKEFTPNDISHAIFHNYQTHLGLNSDTSALNKLSFRSIERHLASLRNFFNVLEEQKLVHANPVKDTRLPINLINQPNYKRAHDYEKEIQAFKDYLYRINCARFTIKNYLADIRQFLTWLESVTVSDERKSLYKYITSESIESYKERLLKIKEFSPVSVNRKLSAIRKFLVYLSTAKLINEPQLLSLSAITNVNPPINDTDSFKELADDLKEDEISVVENKVSRFAPLRLINSIKSMLILILDGIFIIPLVTLYQKSQYKLYKLLGISIFKSLSKNGIKGISNPHLPLDNLIVKGLSMGAETVSIRPDTVKISNISKRFYDPLNISVESLPFFERVYHKLKHVRPRWYKKYHENPISHYLHFSFLLLYIGILIYWLNINLFQNPTNREPVFASLPLSPPRFLSFKGKLTDEANNPILKESALRFSLYRDEFSSGSALLWQEVLSVSPDKDGNFYALLGRNTPLEDNIFKDNPDIYLGVTNGQAFEMSPRQKIATAGLASDSQSLHGLTPITSSGDYKNTLLALDSGGNLSVSGTAGPKFQATEGNFTLSGENLILETNTGSGGSLILNPDDGGFIDLQKPLQNSTLNNNYTSAPGSVEVDDTFAILATSSAVAALNISQDGTGMLISASSSGTAKFTLDYLGNSMIQGSLSLNGGTLTSNQTTFNLLPDNVINLSIGASSTELNLGATSGNTTIRNNLLINGDASLGQNVQDNIYIHGRIASNIIASESGKFDLGSKYNYFNNAYLTNLFLSQTATTSGFLRRESNSVSLLNEADSLLLGGSTGNSALIKLAGMSGQDTFFNAGKVGIGITGSITDSLQVYGDIRVGTTGTDGCLKRYDGTAIAGTCSSDVRLKKDIKVIENVLDKLTSLTPVTFSMRDSEFPEYNFGKKTSYGLIAQEVEMLFPELVETDEKGYKMVKYGPELTMLTLSGVKELNNKVNELALIVKNQQINNEGDILITKQGSEYSLQSPQDNYKSKIIAAYKAVIGSLRVGLLTANEAIFDNLAITTENISVKGLTLRDYIIETIENSDKYHTQLLRANTEISADYISPLSSDSGIGLSLKNSQFSILNSASSTSSAVTTFDNQGNATLSGTLQAQNISTNDASISGTLKVGKIVADEISGLEEKLASIAAKQNNSTASANITNIYNIYNNSSDSANFNRHSTPTPAISPTITAHNPLISSSSAETSNSEYLNLNSEITNDFIPLGSSSAALSYVPNLSTDFSTIHQGLMVLGYTSVVDLSASEQISISGNFILSENSINVLGADLEIQPLKQGNIRFMSGLMTLDTNGNLAVFGDASFAKNVEIKGRLSASLIAPVPGSDLIIQLPGSGNNSHSIINNASLASQEVINDTKFLIKNASGSGVLSVNSIGDLIASGTASFKDLAVGSLNIVRGVQADTSAIDTVASGSAGVGSIVKGYTTRTIYSPFVKEDSLIYISPKSPTIQSGTYGGSFIPYLARQTAEDEKNGIKGSFTVQIPNLSTENVTFNWWVVN